MYGAVKVKKIEGPKCDDTETREITVYHAIDVSRNKASVRAEGRMTFGVLPHTAHVVGSREKEGRYSNG